MSSSGLLRNTGIVFTCLAAISLSMSSVAADAPVTEAPPAEAEYLLFLGDHGLAVIRLQIEIDGKPQREFCRQQILDLCRRADRNQDGQLTLDEYESGVANHPAIRDAQARLSSRPNTAQEKPAFTGGTMPVRDAAAYVSRRIWPSLRVDFSSQRMQRINQSGVMQDRPIADTQLFERLDTDSNRKLTGRELEKAAVVLGKLDFDENDMISQDELRIQSAVVGMSAANPNAAGRRTDAYLSHLATEQINAQFTRRILTLYDGAAKGSVKDLRLDAGEIGMIAEVFTQADADANGFWDFDELGRFLEQPSPSAELRVSLFTDRPAAQVEFHPRDAVAVASLKQEVSRLQIAVQGTRFQWNLPTQAANSGREELTKIQFQSLDGDQNEYLELNELPPSAAPNEADTRESQFVQLDANGDGKVFFDEFQAFARKTMSLQESQFALTVENLGRTLFGPLDANGDGRLSQRELSQLKDRLPEWDADGDGKLVESEIPQQYRLTLSRSADAVIGFNPALANSPYGEVMAPPGGSATGPAWFRKMDRNGDGEISRREFLGPLDRFEKIDANADGAIDADEAAAVK